MLFDTITPELLRTDKVLLKLLRKQQRELELLKKKHGKEKSVILKQHCTVVDRMMASHDRDKQGHERSLEKAIKKKGSVFYCVRGSSQLSPFTILTKHAKRGQGPCTGGSRPAYWGGVKTCVLGGSRYAYKLKLMLIACEI